MKLVANSTLTKLINEQGIDTWGDAIIYVQNIPYGRTSSRTDLSTLITEQKGTCSSKHALLKAIAIENKIPNVNLILCLYKMTETNTPGIGNELSRQGLSYIPEAHCYLRIDNENTDVTMPHSDLTRVQKDILEETEITPEQIGDFKVAYHKAYLEKWISEKRLDKTLDEVWNIRERCIRNLSS